MREQLMKDIAEVTDECDEPLDRVHDLPPVVDHLIALGWRKQEQS
jgi:hypothetical protein